MAKLDSDVRNLINHLYFQVEDTWNDMMAFLWSPDTRPDADLWVEPAADPTKVKLKEEIREFVIQTDQQMQKLPANDFVFGYPVLDDRCSRGSRSAVRVSSLESESPSA